MLLDDIARNRHRVQTILKRMRVALGEKDMLLTLKELAKGNLLSEEQYLKLAELIKGDFKLTQLTDVIKETKIGQGMDFLPRKTGDLIDSLREWMQEFIEKGGTALQAKISSVLDELLQR